MLRKSVFLVVLFLSFATVANADGTADAKKAFQEGNTLFSDSKFIEAADSFRKAYKAKPSWKLLYNIAQAEVAAKRYGLALEAFEAYVAEGGDDINNERTDEVMKEISRLRMLVGVLEVDAPYGAELFIDGYSRGKAPFDSLLRVAVGKRRVNMKYESKVIYGKTLNIAGGMTTQLEATATSVAEESEEEEGPLEPTSVESSGDEPEEAAPPNDDASGVEPAAPSDSPVQSSTGKGNKGLLIGGIASGVGALAGIGLGVAFMVKGGNDAGERDTWLAAYELNRIQENYDGIQEMNDAIKVDDTMTVVGLVAGGALAIASGVLIGLYVKSKKSEKVSVHPTPGGVAVAF